LVGHKNVEIAVRLPGFLYPEKDHTVAMCEVHSGNKYRYAIKKAKIYFQNMLFLSDSPYLKLLFNTVSTITKAFIKTGNQFLYPLIVEGGRL
jgi:hypothetical protein